MWDWYKCEYDTNDLINIKDNSVIEKHIDYNMLKKKFCDSITKITNKYDLSDSEIQKIFKNIENII